MPFFLIPWFFKTNNNKSKSFFSQVLRAHDRIPPPSPGAEQRGIHGEGSKAVGHGSEDQGNTKLNFPHIFSKFVRHSQGNVFKSNLVANIATAATFRGEKNVLY